MPQEFRRPAAYGSQGGRDPRAGYSLRRGRRGSRVTLRRPGGVPGHVTPVRPHARAEPQGERRLRTLAADRLQRGQCLDGGRGQQGQHRFLGVHGAQDPDRVEERARGGSGEQPGQQPAHDSRGEEAGVQSGTGQAQRLVLEDGVPGGGEPGDEPLGVVRVQDIGGADGLVEELSGRLHGDDGGIGEQFGPQPGDLYADGPPGRTPVGQRPAGPVRLGPQPSVELRQGWGLLRRRPRGVGQRTDEQLLLTGAGTGA